MRVIIQNNHQSVSTWIANHIINEINAFAPTAQKRFVLGLCTGSSPIEIYAQLIQANQAGKVDFTNVVTFNMDEYVGLPQNHEGSYYSFMHTYLFNHINIKKENIHMLNGNATNLELECQQFEDAIEKVGGIHLFLGGIGVDGHLAFNEPGTSLTSKTHCQKLTYETLLINSRFFNNDIKQVPTKALTVGVGTVCASKQVVLIVTGHNKARALQQTIEGGVNQMWTASSLQLHPNAIIGCDESACAELKVGTYNYFKEMEQ